MFNCGSADYFIQSFNKLHGYFVISRICVLFQRITLIYFGILKK